FEVVLLGEPPPAPIGDHRARSNGNQGVVRLVILARREKRFVGGNNQQAALVGKRDYLRQRQFLGRGAVTLQFHVQPIAEDCCHAIEPLARQRRVPRDEGLVDGTAGAAGQRNQSGIAGGQVGQGDVRADGRVVPHEGT